MRVIDNLLWGAAIAGLAGGTLFAQMPTANPGARLHKMRAHRGMWGKLMTGYLGLTDQQQAQAKTIFQNTRESSKPLREQLRQVRTDLRAAIREGKPVDQLAANEGNLLGQLAAIRAKSAEQFRALLTPAQLQKLQELHTNRRA
jgi:protein CpxP